MTKRRANSLPGHTCGPEGYYYEDCEGCMYEAEDVKRLGHTPTWATAEEIDAAIPATEWNPGDSGS